jgi:phenylacetaldehyde dehydrogenase
MIDAAREDSMSATAQVNVDDAVRAVPRGLLIGGRWVEPRSGETFPVVDPSTGDELVQVAKADAADLAVAAARQAFDDGPWGSLTPAERGRIVWRIGDLIEEHADELGLLETLDVGKPLAASLSADVPLSAAHFRYMAGLATRTNGTTAEISQPGEWHNYTLREPVGVVGQIIPWNFPLLMAAWKLAPALACGCVVVLKPAEETPLTALRLGALMQEAGVPDGVVNIVTGYGETAGAAIAAHPDVDKVAFTGSTEVGRLIVRAATGNLKKVSLELGGKSPNIVFPDADLEAAITGSSLAIFYNAGEACSAGSRLFAHRKVFDDVVDGVAEYARRIKVGPGLDPDTQMGPLVSEQQLDRVLGYLRTGAEEGAEAITGGARRGETGYFVEPTVLVNTRDEMTVVREEIFGPVVTVQPFEDLDEIARVANDTEYGLAAGIWTKDVSVAHRLARRIRAGAVYVNCYNVTDAAMPFGGYKQSGWGREHADEALELYTEIKAVSVQL